MDSTEPMKLSTSYIIGVGIQRTILNAFGEATTTGADWDLNKFIKTVKDDPGVKNEFNIYKLSDDELLSLGFGRISTECNIRLIPSWIYQFLPDQICVYGASSPEPIVIKKNQLGNPVNGYFGLGILAAGMPISNSEDRAITSEEFNDNDVKVE